MVQTYLPDFAKLGDKASYFVEWEPIEGREPSTNGRRLPRQHGVGGRADQVDVTPRDREIAGGIRSGSQRMA
jgi:glutathione synthase/RimK-type ligase-like ATP-grasp enzyme